MQRYQIPKSHPKLSVEGEFPLSCVCFTHRGVNRFIVIDYPSCDGSCNPIKPSEPFGNSINHGGNVQEFCRVRPKMAFPDIPAFPHNPLLHAALFFNKAQADYFAFQICLHASHPPIQRLCQSQIPSALIRRFTPSSPPQEISKASSE